VKEIETRFAEAKKAWEGIRGTPEGLKLAADGRPTQRPFRLRFEALQNELHDLTDPAAQGFVVHGVREAKKIADTELRIRGEAERLGPVIPRGFLTTFTVPDAPSLPADQSGRLQLAQWLTSPQNPLTARVVVNRVWQHLFGTGLVSTVDNFGIKGDRPSHPELLDHLAGEFIRQGWSTKKLVRQLTLSHTYRLGSAAPEQHQEIDPSNRFIWRHSPRRLETEELRDSMLAISGKLVPKQEVSAVTKLRMVEMRDNGPEAAGIHIAADSGLQRSVYLPQLRGVTPKSLDAFDPVDQTLVTGQRATTTVPMQALFLLNSSFVRQQSLALAERVLKLPAEARLSHLWQLTLGREPSAADEKRATRFLADQAGSYVPPPKRTAPQPAPVVVASAETGGAVVPPANADDVDRTAAAIPEAEAVPADAKSAAWMSLAQVLYASAEFRFIR